MRSLLPLLLVGLVACSGPSSGSAADTDQPSPIPEMTTSLLVIRSASWEATTGRLGRYERTSKGWAPEGTPTDVVLGRSGMGWGRGLHGDGAPHGADGLVKKEGDGRSPAGVFTLGSAYGYEAEPPEGTRVPYVQLTDTWRCVDDGASSRYNEVFDAAGVTPDWSSAEDMRRDDALYPRVVVVEHNTSPAQPGGGSCISCISGAVPMRLEDLEAVAGFLAPDATVLIQMEDAAYRALAEPWGLPM
jgi:L,D-peptidoglycan transpeptidase YkuD (ErfK/YbiS/YcfS/YnhG family)